MKLGTVHTIRPPPHHCQQRMQQQQISYRGLYDAKVSQTLHSTSKLFLPEGFCIFYASLFFKASLWSCLYKTSRRNSQRHIDESFICVNNGNIVCQYDRWYGGCEWPYNGLPSALDLPYCWRYEWWIGSLGFIQQAPCLFQSAFRRGQPLDTPLNAPENKGIKTRYFICPQCDNHSREYCYDCRPHTELSTSSRKSLRYYRSSHQEACYSLASPHMAYGGLGPKSHVGESP